MVEEKLEEEPRRTRWRRVGKAEVQVEVDADMVEEKLEEEPRRTRRKRTASRGGGGRGWRGEGRGSEGFFPYIHGLIKIQELPTIRNERIAEICVPNFFPCSPGGDWSCQELILLTSYLSFCTQKQNYERSCKHTSRITNKILRCFWQTKNVNYNNYMNLFQGVVHLSELFINIFNPIKILASQIPHCGKKSTANPIRTLPWAVNWK